PRHDPARDRPRPGRFGTWPRCRVEAEVSGNRSEARTLRPGRHAFRTVAGVLRQLRPSFLALPQTQTATGLVLPDVRTTTRRTRLARFELATLRRNAVNRPPLTPRKTCDMPRSSTAPPRPDQAAEIPRRRRSLGNRCRAALPRSA